ncbi:MAG TPA: BON domain-containing protein, partial [Rhodospirillales bacterium]|nr:BON domain-containing protein [Rhodospirillales bacterium]
MTTRAQRSMVAVLVAFLTLLVPATDGLAQPVAGAATARALADAGTPAHRDEPMVLEVRRGKLLRLAGDASSVFVADPTIADVQVHSPGLVYLLGKRAGSTTVYAVDSEDRVLLRREVRVEHALSRLREVLRQVVPEADVRVVSVDGGILVQGAVATPAQAEDVRQLAARFLGEKETLINRLQVTAPTQVSLHVRIAEVSREVTRLFGINWDAAVAPGDFVFGLATGRAFNSGGLPFARLTDDNGPAGALAGRFTNGDIDINGLVDALEREGFLTVLAEPNLTALSGETAAFLAGGEFPVPVGTDNGDIEIEFKQFGVSLAFTPTVLSGGRISLRVRPEVSDLSDN